jgi:hypothetical protein
MKMEWIAAEIARILEDVSLGSVFIKWVVSSVARDPDNINNGINIDEAIARTKGLLENLIKLRVWITIRSIEESNEENHG